jgi:predicted CoA-substrate-specific enzyme activase
MKKAYLGVDIGSISTKAAVIDENNKVIASKYIWTSGNPAKAVKDLLKDIETTMDSEYKIVNVGTTGSARKLIGSMLNAKVVKNEITAHAIGTLSIVPDARTIIEIGGQDSKIIIIEDGIVTDYAMNTLCAAGTGSFLSSQAKRLELDIEEFSEMACSSNNPTKIAARCTVFAESDLVHKAQIGHKKEDIVAGLCRAVVHNYLNNVGKGKLIKDPVVFQGGVSKNKGVVREFERELGTKLHVDENGHIMGAIGVAILAKEQKDEIDFSFDITDIEFETKGIECDKCANNCEIICVYKDKVLVDSWGNKCDRGRAQAQKI